MHPSMRCHLRLLARQLATVGSLNFEDKSQWRTERWHGLVTNIHITCTHHTYHRCHTLSYIRVGPPLYPIFLKRLKEIAALAYCEARCGWRPQAQRQQAGMVDMTWARLQDRSDDFIRFYHFWNTLAAWPLQHLGCKPVKASLSFSPVVDFLEPRLRFPASVVGVRGTPNVTLTYAQSVLGAKCVKNLISQWLQDILWIVKGISEWVETRRDSKVREKIVLLHHIQGG